MEEKSTLKSPIQGCFINFRIKMKFLQLNGSSMSLKKILRRAGNLPIVMAALLRDYALIMFIHHNVESNGNTISIKPDCSLIFAFEP